MSDGNIREVDPKKDRARKVRIALLRNLRMILDGQGDDLAGYALVAWDGRGEATTAIRTADGPIGSGMMPLYVKDVLDRHVVCNLMASEMAEPELPPDAS